MVGYKTRIFYENDTGMVGAEVKLYNEEGDNIDNIIITSESKFKELSDKIMELDETYIDIDELTQVLINASESLIINATKFQGHTPDDFAFREHSHGEYAGTNHASASNIYGLGNDSNYGHVKLIDNLGAGAFREGEALSAYQGAALLNKINEAVANMCKWEKITLSGYDNVANYCNLYVNKALKLARVTYFRKDVKKGVDSPVNSTTGKKNNPSPYSIEGKKTVGGIYLHKEGAIPEGYRPTTNIQQPIYRPDIGIRVTSNGAILIYNSSGGTNQGNGFDVYVNILYHY